MKADSKKALIYSTIYVGLGTIANLCNYGSDWCFGEWTVYLTMLTFPVSIIAFGIRFTTSEGYLIPLIIGQLITLVITWRIVLYVMRK
ncbi:hypothetical protein [Roseivirga pacifica]|uniref:hypothetical protein n=1 Tax=Roseivirga pacifica TaxID=1267423 RepID=UPI003BAFB0E8